MASKLLKNSLILAVIEVDGNERHWRFDTTTPLGYQFELDFSSEAEENALFFLDVVFANKAENTTVLFNYSALSDHEELLRDIVSITQAVVETTLPVVT